MLVLGPVQAFMLDNSVYHVWPKPESVYSNSYGKRFNLQFQKSNNGSNFAQHGRKLWVVQRIRDHIDTMPYAKFGSYQIRGYGDNTEELYGRSDGRHVNTTPHLGRLSG